jgi:hypothetical protein
MFEDAMTTNFLQEEIAIFQDFDCFFSSHAFSMQLLTMARGWGKLQSPRTHADIHHTILQAIPAPLDASLRRRSLDFSLPRGFRLRTWEGPFRTDESS